MCLHCGGDGGCGGCVVTIVVTAEGVVLVVVGGGSAKEGHMLKECRGDDPCHLLLTQALQHL